MGLHLVEVSSPIFELFRGRKRVEERKYILTSFFCARKLLSLVAHIRVRFENTIAGPYNY